jgi:hypothetical protein
MLKQATLSVLLCLPVSAVGGSPCVQFSVVVQDTLKNVKQGLSLDDQKWFREKVEKKNPSVCYRNPEAVVCPIPQRFLGHFSLNTMPV